MIEICGVFALFQDYGLTINPLGYFGLIELRSNEARTSVIL